jgi:1-hydroxycarotenoid 3,4-desaturase
MAAVPPMPRAARSLSAVTWSMVAETAGFPLAHHNVFFSGDYRAEFEAIFRHGRVPEQPTVYVCAQDRGDGVAAPAGAERLLVLVNAPPSGDVHTFPPPEIESCAERTFAQLERCGLNVRRRPEATTATSPADFERLFPGTGGALYGRAPHGWRASFQRPGARTRLPGLYLAGGSVHPGPGVPMAAMSGRLAAARLMADLASTFRSRATATPGGMSTRSATTAGTG